MDQFDLFGSPLYDLFLLLPLPIYRSSSSFHPCSAPSVRSPSGGLLQFALDNKGDIN